MAEELEVTPSSSFWTIAKSVIFPNRGSGASSTKWAYATVTGVGVLCFFLGTYAIVHVYIRWHKCDLVMVGFVSGIFTVLTSWVAHVQNKKALATIAQTGVDDGSAANNPKVI